MYCNKEDKVVNFTPVSCNCSRLGRKKQMQMKGAPNCGHKCSEWILWPYPKLLEAFEWYIEGLVSKKDPPMINVLSRA